MEWTSAHAHQVFTASRTCAISQRRVETNRAANKHRDDYHLWSYECFIFVVPENVNGTLSRTLQHQVALRSFFLPAPLRWVRLVHLSSRGPKRTACAWRSWSVIPSGAPTSSVCVVFFEAFGFVGDKAVNNFPVLLNHAVKRLHLSH